MIKMTCCFCGEEMKMENGAGHSCETTYSPAKTLTDEEIIGCAQDVKYSELSIAVNDFYILFARAILKKANNG